MANLDFTQVILYLLLVILILFGIFLLIREVVCWYWKINKRIELQEQQNEYLKRIADKLAPEEKKNEIQVEEGQDVEYVTKDNVKYRVCPKCGTENKASLKFCWRCGQSFPNRSIS